MSCSVILRASARELVQSRKFSYMALLKHRGAGVGFLCLSVFRAVSSVVLHSIDLNLVLPLAP